MASRLIAGVVLFAGCALLAFVALRSDPATETIEVTAEQSSAGSTASATTPTTAAPAMTEAPVVDPPENLGRRRDLTKLDGWLNTTEIDSLDDLDGQVVLVEMWTFGCHNCKARIPHNQELYAEYRDQGFEIVGVHAPEFDYEADVANIEEAIEKLGVTWPVALDTQKANFRKWQEGGRRFWPRTFLVDQNGDVRFDHIGEGAYDELADTVGWLLDNPPS